MQCLTVTDRHDTPSLSTPAEEVGHGEVCELQSHAAYDTGLSPSEGELHLVVGLLLQVPVDVDSTVLIVRLHIRCDGLRVEIAHARQLTCRTLEGLLREQVSRLSTELTAYDILVEAVVAVDAYMADVRLLSLIDTHLQVYGVADDVHLCRSKTIEDVSIVPIFISDGIVIARKSLLEIGLVVHISLLHVEQTREVISRIDGVADPCYVADVVLLSLINLQVDVHMLIVDIPDTVLQYLSVTVSVLVIFRYEVLLILCPSVRCELLRLEKVAQLPGLVYLLEGAFGEQVTFQLLIRQLAVAINEDMPYPHFLLFVDINVEDDLILVGHIITLADVHLSILVSLVVEVFLGEGLRAVYHVRGYLSSLDKSELLVHILALAFLQSDVVDSRDARTCLQIDVQVDLVSDEGVGRYRHIGEQSMLPVALYGLRNLVSRQRYFLSDGKSGDTCENIIIVSLYARCGQSADDNSLRSTGIGYLWIDNLLVLCIGIGHHADKSDAYHQYFVYITLHQYLFVNSFIICSYTPRHQALSSFST